MCPVLYNNNCFRSVSIRLSSKKGTSRQRSGKGAIRKRFPLQKPRWEKTKLTIRYLYHETYRKPNEQLFPNRWPLSYLNLTKNMETYIRRQQHKKIFIHQNIKQKEPPQKYRQSITEEPKLKKEKKKKKKKKKKVVF